MSIGKSLLFAAGITAISAVTLVLTRGMPTLEQVIMGGTTMFVVAFVVMKFWGGDKKQ